MIHVLDKNGQRCDDGINLMQEILDKRVDGSLIEREDAAYCAWMTGGVIRQFFQAISAAALSARYLYGKKKQPHERITRDNIETGLQEVKADLKDRISLQGVDPEYLRRFAITHQSLESRLRTINKVGCHTGIPEPEDQILLEAQALIAYNGESYFCVHPLVKALL